MKLLRVYDTGDKYRVYLCMDPSKIDKDTGLVPEDVVYDEYFSKPTDGVNVDAYLAKCINTAANNAKKLWEKKNAEPENINT